MVSQRKLMAAVLEKAKTIDLEKAPRKIIKELRGIFFIFQIFRRGRIKDYWK